VLSEAAVEVCNGGLVSMDSRPIIKDGSDFFHAAFDFTVGWIGSHVQKEDKVFPAIVKSGLLELFQGSGDDGFQAFDWDIQAKVGSVTFHADFLLVDLAGWGRGNCSTHSEEVFVSVVEEGNEN